MKTELVTNLEKQTTKLLEGIAKGEQAIREGRTFTNAEARERLKKWLK